MSGSYIWGTLNRTTNDPTLIDEAIAEAVEAHNDDPTSHVGAGQALESHRAAEIIDHRAESIVNDKLQPKTRAWTAIVDPQSEYDYSTVQGAVEYVNSIGGGSVFVKRGRHPIVNNLFIDGKTEIHGEGMGETVLFAPTGSSVTVDLAGANYNDSYYHTWGSYLDGNGDLDEWESGSTTWLWMDEMEMWDSMTNGTRFILDGDGIERRVTQNIGFGMIRFTPGKTPDDVNAEISTLYPIRFQNNSNIAELLVTGANTTGWDNSNFSIFDSNGNIMANYDSFNPATRQFVLEDPWTGGNTSFVGFVGVGYGELNTIRGVSFEGALGSMWVQVALTDRIRPLSVQMIECEFRGNNMDVGMIFSEEYRGVFDRCNFRLTKTGLVHIIQNATIRSCKLLFERASAQSLFIGQKVEVLDCLISNDGFATAGFLQGDRGEFLISNCTVLMNGARTIGALNAGRLTFTDSYIELLGAGHLTLRGQQVVIGDNVVRSRGAGRLVVAGNATILTAIGNITSHAMTVTGVPTPLINNLVRNWT